jgi:hypothetical protein
MKTKLVYLAVGTALLIGGCSNNLVVPPGYVGMSNGQILLPGQQTEQDDISCMILVEASPFDGKVNFDDTYPGNVRYELRYIAWATFKVDVSDVNGLKDLLTRVSTRQASSKHLYEEFCQTVFETGAMEVMADEGAEIVNHSSLKKLNGLLMKTISSRLQPPFVCIQASFTDVCMSRRPSVIYY